jgi:hypothetical protein
MKRSLKGISGTSFHGDMIIASKHQLVELLGKPNYQDSPEDKTQNEWICESEEGEVFTIYDWKEYRVYGDDELIEWHIGGYNRAVTMEARMEIKKHL